LIENKSNLKSDIVLQADRAVKSMGNTSNNYWIKEEEWFKSFDDRISKGEKVKQEMLNIQHEGFEIMKDLLKTENDQN
jgi:hypothetical protein